MELLSTAVYRVPCHGHEDSLVLHLQVQLFSLQHLQLSDTAKRA